MTFPRNRCLSPAVVIGMGTGSDGALLWMVVTVLFADQSSRMVVGGSIIQSPFAVGMGTCLASDSWETCGKVCGCGGVGDLWG